MLKQFLTGGAILALGLVGNLNVSARTIASVFQAQVPEAPSTTVSPDGSTTQPSPDGSTTEPVPDSSITQPSPDGSTTIPVPNDTNTNPGGDGSITTPSPDGSTTEPSPDGSTTEPVPDSTTELSPDVSNSQECEFIPRTSASGGGTRERLHNLQQCNKTE